MWTEAWVGGMKGLLESKIRDDMDRAAAGAHARDQLQAQPETAVGTSFTT
jgi:hypothetical protein